MRITARWFDRKQLAMNDDISALEGLGLMSMRETAELTGGAWGIYSEAGYGTTIIASW